ncbi:hypothetical protein Ddye_000364 [Dipteronia dyeriana]|uniref:RNase H type-1 domain-containing protein n=1 Tax=Dipteronia dyeriana TaxID=168575 RepID=A0AAD9XM66_9ROSI|nr:hypothetical protein Ddye_000364 [Dipteronia dyeriana]
MILFLELNLDYLLNAKRILRCFELVSGLKINFLKSCLVRMGKTRPGEDDWTTAPRCSSSSLPVKYLGLPLGGWWGVFACSPGSIAEWVKGWSSLCYPSASKRVWNILFFAIVRTIWEIRNDMIFHGIITNLGKALDTIKFRVALWFKNNGVGAEADLSLLKLDLKERCVDFGKAKKSKIKVMASLSGAQLYFHVDGFSRGNPGDSGIGGVLRDHGDKIFCLFSFSLGWSDVVTAEVLAIHSACQLIVDNHLLNGRCIDILSDSKTMVSWCNDDDIGNSSLVNFVYDIGQLLLS